MYEVERDTTRWAHEVAHRCDLGDPRRTRRLVQVLDALAAHTGRSLHRACGGDTSASEGAYRLIRNDSVEPQAIGEGGFAATVEAARGVETLLAVEDSTTLSYHHCAAAELGPTNSVRDGRGKGLLVHSVLLLDAHSGRTLGLVEQRRWSRESTRHGQKHQRKKRPYAEKESAKWEQASRRMVERLGAQTMKRVISVCDREADIYEYLRYKSQQRYVVRASWDRRLDGESSRLFERLEAAPVVGHSKVEVAQRGGPAGRKKRVARLEIRATRVRVGGPKRAPTLAPVEVNALCARELGGAGGGQPIRWMVLTSEPVETLEAATTVLRYYALRWRIEEFHKAWKTGTRVEQQRMHSAANLERMAVVLAFVAVRLLQVRETLLEDEAAEQRPCTEVLDEVEWKILWLSRTGKRPPNEAPSLRWAYESIAKLGGWIDTKRTGRASWTTVWDGWFRLQDRVDGYRVAQSLTHDADL